MFPQHHNTVCHAVVSASARIWAIYGQEETRNFRYTLKSPVQTQPHHVSPVQMSEEMSWKTRTERVTDHPTTTKISKVPMLPEKLLQPRDHCALLGSAMGQRHLTMPRLYQEARPDTVRSSALLSVPTPAVPLVQLQELNDVTHSQLI